MTKMFDRNGRRTMQFSKIIANGENPKGFTAQVPSGTAKCGPNPGWNKQYNYERPQSEATGVWANGNRTAE